MWFPNKEKVVRKLYQVIFEFEKTYARAVLLNRLFQENVSCGVASPFDPSIQYVSGVVEVHEETLETLRGMAASVSRDERDWREVLPRLNDYERALKSFRAFFDKADRDMEIARTRLDKRIDNM
jgi:hypothetical protein